MAKANFEGNSGLNTALGERSRDEFAGKACTQSADRGLAVLRFARPPPGVLAGHARLWREAV